MRLVPTHEVFSTGDSDLDLVDLAWPAGRPDAAVAAIAELLATVPAGTTVHVRCTNPDEERLAVIEAAGFVVYQEKRGYWWEDDGSPAPPPRLATRRLVDVGADAYAALVAECHHGSLDRHDRHRAALVGAGHEARLMLTYYDGVADRESWLVGERDGEPVGFVAVSDFGEEGVGTVVYIGVRPAYRGRGHVDDLLRMANLAARARGMRAMLSDVDVQNAPMDAAMRRAGHLPGIRPRHVWHHTTVVGG